MTDEKISPGDGGPCTLTCAYSAWLYGDLFYGADGQYRLKSNRGRVAPFSNLVREHHADVDDFHRVATAFNDFSLATQKRIGAVA